MTVKPLNTDGGKQVLVHYDGETYGPIPDSATEDDVREALQKDHPGVANANFTKNPETGDWTVTRRAGEKG